MPLWALIILQNSSNIFPRIHSSYSCHISSYARFSGDKVLTMTFLSGSEDSELEVLSYSCYCGTGDLKICGNEHLDPRLEFRKGCTMLKCLLYFSLSLVAGEGGHLRQALHWWVASPALNYPNRKTIGALSVRLSISRNHTERTGRLTRAQLSWMSCCLVFCLLDTNSGPQLRGCSTEKMPPCNWPADKSVEHFIG